MGTTEVDEVIIRGRLAMRVASVDALAPDGVLVNPAAPRIYFGGTGLVWKGVRFEDEEGNKIPITDMVEPGDELLLTVNCTGPFPVTVVHQAQGIEPDEQLVTSTGLDAYVGPYRRRVQVFYDWKLGSWSFPDWSQ